MNQLNPNLYYLNFTIKWGIENYEFRLKFNIEIFGFTIHKLYLRNAELQSPSSLYKFYRPTTDNLNSLIEKYLYFPDPTNFNDPFDCLSHKNNHLTSINGESKVHRENLGVCCFSKIKDSVQMWGLYTDSYKGFCLKFKNDEYFMQYQECLNIKSHVLYLKNLLTDHPNFIETIEGIENHIHDIEFRKWIKDFVTYYYQYCSKANSWKYEKEYRMISLFAQQCNRKIHFLSNNVEEIYIGYNMEQVYRNLLVNILKSDYPHAKIFEVRPNSNKIKLDFQRILK